MSDEHQRVSDMVLGEMHQDIKDIKKILIGEKGDNGLCGRMGIIEIKRDSTQLELTEHKKTHWQFVGFMIGVASVIVAIIEVVIK